jgi:hypothetical protein
LRGFQNPAFQGIHQKFQKITSLFGQADDGRLNVGMEWNLFLASVGARQQQAEGVHAVYVERKYSIFSSN